MPYIKRKEIKERNIPYRHNNQSADFYNSEAWKRLRNTYIKEHPLCECCLQHEKINPAEEIHHRRPFLTGSTDEEKWSLFLNEKNLISVCSKCHSALHYKGNIYHLQTIDNLTDKEYNYAHNIH